MVNIEFDGSRMSVGTSPAVIFQGVVSKLQTLELQAVGACEIGGEGVSVGNGIPLLAGISRFVTHLDFRKDDREVQSSVLKIYAVASVGTTIQVSKIVRG